VITVSIYHKVKVVITFYFFKGGHCWLWIPFETVDWIPIVY